MDRMKKLVDVIRSLIQEEFSGYIKINFSQGSLGRIEKSEEFFDAAGMHAIEKSSRKKRDLEDLSLRLGLVFVPVLASLILGMSAGGM